VFFQNLKHRRVSILICGVVISCCQLWCMTRSLVPPVYSRNLQNLFINLKKRIVCFYFNGQDFCLRGAENHAS
jgi:hypothetical protein